MVGIHNKGILIVVIHNRIFIAGIHNKEILGDDGDDDDGVRGQPRKLHC